MIEGFNFKIEKQKKLKQDVYATNMVIYITHFNMVPFTIEVDNLHLQETVKHDFTVFIFF